MRTKAAAHLLDGSWPTESLLAQIGAPKHTKVTLLNRQAVFMARHEAPQGNRFLPKSLIYC